MPVITVLTLPVSVYISNWALSPSNSVLTVCMHLLLALPVSGMSIKVVFGDVPLYYDTT